MTFICIFINGKGVVYFTRLIKKMVFVYDKASRVCYLFLFLPKIFPIILVELLVENETKDRVRSYSEPGREDSFVQACDALGLENLEKGVEQTFVENTFARCIGFCQTNFHLVSSFSFTNSISFLFLIN